MPSSSTANSSTITQAIQKVVQIATLPEITFKIIQAVEDPRSTAKHLEDIIKHDVALSAKVLKVVNSAFYGLPRQVGSVERAIVLLGLSTVKNIAVATSMTKLFSGKDTSGALSPRELWRHSLACGVFCKLLAQFRHAENCDEIFVAGLMHDVGILVEKQVYPERLAEVIELAQTRNIELCEAETEIFEADHQAFGSALTTKWKFPEMFRLSTGYHHQPLKAGEQHRTIAATVHLADTLASRQRIGFHLREAVFYDEVMDVLELTDQNVAEVEEAFEEKFEAAESVME